MPLFWIVCLSFFVTRVGLDFLIDGHTDVRHVISNTVSFAAGLIMASAAAKQ